MNMSLEQRFIFLVESAQIFTTDRIKDRDDLVKRSLDLGSLTFHHSQTKSFKTKISSKLYGPKNNIIIWSDDMAHRRDLYANRRYFVGVYTETKLYGITDEYGNPIFYEADIYRLYDEDKCRMMGFDSLREAQAFVKKCGF